MGHAGRNRAAILGVGARGQADSALQGTSPERQDDLSGLREQCTEVQNITARKAGCYEHGAEPCLLALATAVGIKAIHHHGFQVNTGISQKLRTTSTRSLQSIKNGFAGMLTNSLCAFGGHGLNFQVVTGRVPCVHALI